MNSFKKNMVRSLWGKTALVAFASFSVLIAPLLNAETKNALQRYQALTGEKIDSDKTKWEIFYKKHENTYVYGKEPSELLVKSKKYFPPKGRSLDLAMGEGRNVVYMAQQGYKAEGVDIAVAATEKAKRLASERKVSITTIIADLKNYTLPKDSYDVITVFFFFDRALNAQLHGGLKKGGLLVFENNLKANLKYNHAQDPKYLLEPGELKMIFPESQFEILEYTEKDTGKEAVASVVARKK